MAAWVSMRSGIAPRPPPSRRPARPTDPRLASHHPMACPCGGAALGTALGPMVARRSMDVRKGFVDLVGNTPLVRLNKVSDATGCEILGKCEFMNPGSSVKDRAALAIILDAEEKGCCAPAARSSRAPPATPGSAWRWSAMCAATKP